MNAVLGAAEIQLQKEGNSEDTDEAFGVIYTSGNLLLNIINDILDLSKIEAGKLELLRAKYDIASLVFDSMQLNLLRYESNPIEFTLKIDKDTPYEVFGDELRIKQILNNVLSNAFKYTETGGIELSVSSEIIDAKPGELEDKGGNFILILTVSDTGRGMTSDQVDVLFDEYTRFAVDTGRTTAGTGLGMHITKRLIDMMNGEIIVKSEPGVGSVFTIRLPQRYLGATVCGPDLADRLRSNRFQRMLKLRKAQVVNEYMPYGSVLIVDDVEANLYVAKGMMLPYGLKIETVSSGFDAVNRIESGSVYDIIFMDHMMPGMDGIEATRIIREKEYKEPIVALTANALAGQAEIFMANGFDGFIAKPIDIRELNIMLNRMIRDKQTPDVIAAARHETMKTADSGEAGADTKPDDIPLDEELIEAVLTDIDGALALFGDIFPEFYTNNDSETAVLFTTTVHGIKSALYLINESELAETAYRLERAGDNMDMDTISSETPALIEALKALAVKYQAMDKIDLSNLSI